MNKDNSNALRPQLSSLSLISLTPFGKHNKRVSGSGLEPSPKSPSATSDTRKTLYKIGTLLYSIYQFI